MSTDVSDVRAASIIVLMIEVARNSETSVDIQLRTRKYMQKILSFSNVLFTYHPVIRHYLVLVTEEAS